MAPLAITCRKGAWRFMQAMASAHWAAGFFVLMALSSLAVARQWGDPTPLMWAPFGLLALSLVSAMVVRPRLRVDMPLLIFHLALLALVLLFALARGTYLDATTAVSQGQFFEGETLTREQGPWHDDQLAHLRFQNLGIVARYNELGEYLGTHHRVQWMSEDGRWHLADIGDDRPLVMRGYRIYATFHRGLSPRFVWETALGERHEGTVQLKDHREGGELRPSATWALPGGPEVGVTLVVEKPLNAGRQQRDLGADDLPHHLVLHHGAESHELRPGQGVALPGGRLVYVGPMTWMSYRIVHDPTVPWTLAALAIGVISLVAFYWQRVFRRPLSEFDA